MTGQVKPAEYSIVIPVYNSEASLVELHSRIQTVMKGISDNYEIFFVNDSSKDNSWEILKSLRNSDIRVKIIHLLRNFGEHNAVFCGLHYCSGNIVIILDDDLQNPPEEIPKFIEKIQAGSWVVFGRYRQKMHSRSENFLSAMFQHLMHTILQYPRNIYISSFTAMRGEVARNIINLKSSYPFIPALIIQSAPMDKITNADVLHLERKVGRSTYTPFKYFQLFLNLVINFSSLPLIFVGTFGFMISILSIGYGVYIFLQKLLNPDFGLIGWNSLIVATTFLGGMILLSMAIIGEYLRRILAEISYGRPYIVREADV